MIRTRGIATGDFTIGGDGPLLFIAGPDTLESRDLVLEVARELRRLRDDLGVQLVFKGSYDKANRTAHTSYRGPGIDAGLALLRNVKEVTGLPLTTDVHSPSEAQRAAEVVDILQIPAFLCRQNDLLEAAGRTGRVVNVKKGQFLPPWNVAERVAAATGDATPGVVITERGTTFGHGDLINDFRGVVQIRSEGTPVVFDATHSVQRPGGLGGRSGGSRELIPFLARAAAGAGCDGFFFEVHPRPEEALCDGPCSLELGSLGALIEQLVAIDAIARRPAQ